MATLAELLRELKDRSGLSYGVLAKRLHMSTSTLHRYCNGDAVPTEFAPVERFARLCKASPDELVEVHRRWILADAARGRKAEPERAEPAPVRPEPAQTPPGPGRENPDSEPESVTDRPRRSPAHRRRPLILAAAVAAVVGISSVALAMNGDSDSGKKRDTGAAASPRPGDSPDAAPTGKDRKKGDDQKKDDDEKENGASASPSRSGGPDHKTTRGPGKGPASAGGNSGSTFDVPVTVRTRPYAMDDPCMQDFLVNRKASEVPEQPAVQDAAGWVGDLGAVPAGRQLIEVTVQGTGDETVVLQDMNVRVQSTSAPLAWNNFQMATGCGGDVDPKSFSIDLDDGSPQVKPQSGQRDFPYKVSEKDPEVFFIIANTDLHDVRWYLELEWSSGKRHDSLRIDDQSKPFRTSGKKGRPTYGWPPGSDKWSRQLQDG
ncbi:MULTISPECIES: helix-turn-helix transcriptional regulator [unclassified Streptomyces]|uniref:helix-turn-helix domain-containing protein n=1 Tax=unclassified Streptomyces TaxID=2593676 RepID=UPI00136F0495|nr:MULTISPECIES: helix-turn-helix transcriptional regulator [unclassified Streptomyces]NEA03499.1 helix-turn-helix domain-containing protein [Streptomyces sp. SID10116]MYY85872.1 helix-turn-helix domain-containing protein [Streptomyces sp. SID335]MYZ12241.1 helix-turn-helix domain-containing protein [Streptomyces sp. SID337]NDZ90099.1 helix-turn-helix domain-containing protein [Streptomyces sp. SID10115]NEB45799.1 helix-turn-helix domain-containing protein [Streptomyces sp. SID339]